MKQDLVLFSYQSVHNARVCDFLKNHDIDAEIMDNIQSMSARLLSHSPAFLLLDFEINGSKTLLSEVTSKILRPPPYTIISASPLNGTFRTTMLQYGVDANERQLRRVNS